MPFWVQRGGVTRPVSRSRASFSPGLRRVRRAPRVRRARRVTTAVVRTPQRSRVRRTGDTPVAAFLPDRRFPSRRCVVGKPGARKAPLRRPMHPEPKIGRCAQWVFTTLENIFHVPTRGCRRDDSRAKTRLARVDCPTLSRSKTSEPSARSQALACVRRSDAYVSILNP